MSTPPAKPIARPLYSLDGIVIGTLLGSLAAGIYMVTYNYVTLGSMRLARQSVIAGSILYAAILFASWMAPSNLWIALVFALGQAGLAYLLAGRLQGATISYYLQHGGTLHGLFRSALVGLLVGLLSFAVIWGLVGLAMG